MSISKVTITNDDGSEQVFTPAVSVAPVDIQVEVTPGATPTANIISITNKQ